MNKTIHLAGGCFWGAEKYLALLDAVIETDVGYANGTTANPTYEQVCTGASNHAEVVRVVYNGEISDLTYILDQFYKAIDPIAVNQQGEDVGTQYRTGIYYSDKADEPIIRQSIARLQAKHTAPIAVEIAPLTCYYPAEDYHQKYLDKNPQGYCHIGCDLFDEAARH